MSVVSSFEFVSNCLLRFGPVVSICTKLSSNIRRLYQNQLHKANVPEVFVENHGSQIMPISIYVSLILSRKNVYFDTTDQ